MSTSNAARLGRPRDPRLDETILATTVKLIGELGYAGVSIDAIASAAGITKPTIYRRWASKALLAADALNSRRPVLTAPPDQNSLRGDLLQMMLGDYKLMQSEAGVVLGVAFAGRHDPELGAALGRRLDHESQVRLEVILDRAVRRGELAARPEVVMLCHTLDTLMLGTLLRRQPSTDVAMLTDVLDELILPSLHRLAASDPTTERASS